jgi:hypothetical protein
LNKKNRVDETNLIFTNSFNHSKYIEELKILYKSNVIENAFNQSKVVTIEKNEFICEAIYDNIKNKKAFSLIRLGDGEGNFLLGNDKESMPFSALKGYSSHILRNWFGNSEVHDQSKLYDLLKESIRNSNYCGIPNNARLQFEKEKDARGFWGTLGVYKILDFVCKENIFCNANIHEHLFKNQMFIDALKMSNSISTITCHQEFGSIIRAKLNISTGYDILCPGEKGIPQLPDTKKEGSHWPNYFIKISEDINKIDSGSVVLVGAGVLGKIYCNLAKNRGLFAVDIGAIADWFCGTKTRAVFNDKSYGKDFLI